MLNYCLGHGVSQDFRIARRYFQKASDQKLGAASYMVGLIRFKARDFRKNDAQARRYFAKAASEGDANGQYMYSYFLLTGEGKKARPRFLLGQSLYPGGSCRRTQSLMGLGRNCRT